MICALKIKYREDEMEKKKEDSEEIGDGCIFVISIIIVIIGFIIFSFLEKPLSFDEQCNGYRQALHIGEIEFRFERVVGSYKINWENKTISLKKESLPKLALFSSDELEAIVRFNFSKSKKGYNSVSLEKKFRKLIGWNLDDKGIVSFKMKKFPNFAYFSKEELEKLSHQKLPRKGWW